MEGTPENFVQKYLGKEWVVHITDGRKFVGMASCIDKNKNLIMMRSKEFCKNEERSVGVIMIPGKHILRIEIDGEKDSNLIKSYA